MSVNRGKRKGERWLHPQSNDTGVFVPEPDPDTVGCNVYPRVRQQHQDKIHADDCVKRKDAAEIWCDCCGKQPVAIFPMFNRLRHTVRLCEECLSLGLAALDNLYEIQKRQGSTGVHP